MWSVYTHFRDTLQGINISHLGKRNITFKMPFLEDMLVPWRVYFTHCELCLVKTFWYYILPNGLKVSRYLYLYIKHSNFYKIIKYIYTKNHHTIISYIMYWIYSFVSMSQKYCVPLLESLICFMHFFGGFQHFNYWRPGSKIYSAVLAVSPKMLTPRVRLRSDHLEVDGRYCWWLRNPARNRVEVGSFSDFYRVFIHPWLFVFSINSSIGHHPFPQRNILIPHSHTVGFRSSYVAQKGPSLMEKNTLHKQQLPVSSNCFQSKKKSPTHRGEKKHTQTQQRHANEDEPPGLRQIAVLAKQKPIGAMLVGPSFPGAPDAPCAPASKAARINGFKCGWMGLRLVRLLRELVFTLWRATGLHKS